MRPDPASVSPSPRRRHGGWVVLLCLALIGQAVAAEPDHPTGDRAVENLAAFARAYGYVRFFCPSDQAAAVDWQSFGVYGAGEVADAADRTALAAALTRVFSPIAPALVIRANGSTPSATPAPAAAETRLTFWQYEGLKLSSGPGPYRQRRVIPGERGGDREPLFEPATPPPAIHRDIGAGLTLDMPSALPVNDAVHTLPEPGAGFADLQAKLAEIDLAKPTYANWRVRCAAIVETWPVFEHFQPYLTSAGVDWNATLAPALRNALAAHDANDIYLALMGMIAASQDGHGFVYGRPSGGWIPIRVGVIENQIVVTGVADNAPFQRGDVIERVDGTPALDVLAARERVTSGGANLRRFRALNQFTEGPVDSRVVVDIRRGGSAQTIEFVRTPEHLSYFFNPIPEFTHAPLEEIRPGIFYVNLYTCDVPTLEQHLPELAAARGVIFDDRPGMMTSSKKFQSIRPHVDIIPHLIDSPVQASPMLVPRLTQPDREGWTYRESTWPVAPKAPRLKGQVVFINEPSVVSYGETCMAMIADYHLAKLVGAPTAGTNGNVNFIPLPGGLRVMWTGMDVRKHDHTAFYGTGFVPDFPVARTIEAVKNGRDEYLDKAIEVIDRAL